MGITKFYNLKHWCFDIDVFFINRFRFLRQIKLKTKITY